MQLLEAGGLQAGGPGEVGRTLRLVCARPTNSRGSRYPRCRPAVTTGHPESTWRVSRGLREKLSHFSETSRPRQGSRPGDSSDRPGQGRGGGGPQDGVALAGSEPPYLLPRVSDFRPHFGEQEPHPRTYDALCNR